MNWGNQLRLVPVVFCCIAAKAAAEEKHWYDRFELGGFVDVYYAYNMNRPTSGDNYIPGEGTDGKKHNQFSLDLAAIELHVRAPIICHLVLNWGTATEVEHVNEPGGDFLGPEVWKVVQQAYLGYRIPVGRGLTVEAGIYPSHIGFEDFVSKNNWNYTRGWLAENQPYYQTGIKLTYPFTDHFSAQFHYLNGWQNIGENNNWKTFGTGFLYSRPRFSLYLNTLIGPEQPMSHDTWRFLFDLIALVNVSAHWQVALNADYGFEQLSAGGIADWYGAALYGRWSPRDWFAMAARFEWFHDGLGTRVTNGLTGVEQTLYEGTLTLEGRVLERLLLRFEARYDNSDQAVFDGHGRDLLTNLPLKVHDQGLFVLSAVATL
jgi:hypothetical protein